MSYNTIQYNTIRYNIREIKKNNNKIPLERRNREVDPIYKRHPQNKSENLNLKSKTYLHIVVKTVQQLYSMVLSQEDFTTPFKDISPKQIDKCLQKL